LTVAWLPLVASAVLAVIDRNAVCCAWKPACEPSSSEAPLKFVF
jgi:hypothetical protein